MSFSLKGQLHLEIIDFNNNKTVISWEKKLPDKLEEAKTESIKITHSPFKEQGFHPLVSLVYPIHKKKKNEKMSDPPFYLE